MCPVPIAVLSAPTVSCRAVVDGFSMLVRVDQESSKIACVIGKLETHLLFPEGNGTMILSIVARSSSEDLLER